MSDPGFAYVDSSAFVKLFHAESESAALRPSVEQWPRRVSSELLAVEATRAARRLGEDASELALAALRGVSLIPLSRAIRDAAAALRPPELRSLDAIHLATALSLGDRVGVLFAYDRRLLAAAATAGIAVLAPPA